MVEDNSASKAHSILKCDLFELPGRVPALSAFDIVKDCQLVTELDGMRRHVKEMVIKSLIV